MRLKYIFSLLVTVGILLSSVSCKTTSTSSNKSSAVDVFTLHQVSWEQIFAQQEENYLVYIYGGRCNSCQLITEEVTTFALAGFLPLLFVNSDDPENDIPRTRDAESSYGATSYQDVSILGIPTIIEIFKGVLIAIIAGTEACLTFLYEKRLNISK